MDQHLLSDEIIDEVEMRRAPSFRCTLLIKYYIAYGDPLTPPAENMKIIG